MKGCGGRHADQQPPPPPSSTPSPPPSPLRTAHRKPISTKRVPEHSAEHSISGGAQPHSCQCNTQRLRVIASLSRRYNTILCRHSACVTPMKYRTPQNTPVAELAARKPEFPDPDIHKPVTVRRAPVTSLHESVTVRWHSSAVICCIGARSIEYVKQVCITSVGGVESLLTVTGLFSSIPRLEIEQTASVF